MRDFLLPASSVSDPATLTYLVTAAAIVLAAAAIWISVVVWRRSVVSKSSAAVRELRAVSAEYAEVLAPQKPIRLDFPTSAKSKAQFDRLDLSAFLATGVLSEEGWIQQEIQSRLHATYEFGNYQVRVGAISKDLLGTSGHRFVRIKKYNALERKIFKKKELKYPTPKARVTASVSYRSPKGQNAYSRNLVWNFEELREELRAAVDTRARLSTAEARRRRERSLMTPSLRMQILRRDGSRCRMCGASASDGATLQIDHINPVSHGGPTTPENLQTLCQPCNAGKSNRFVG